jgi:cation transport ATPase
MAMWLALGKAAKRGVLFVGGAAVEGLARVRVVAFDKTGTLSDGEPQVAEFLAESTASNEDGRVLAVAAGLSRSSTHVLSRSIVRFAAGRGVEPSATAVAVPIDGAGLSGEVASRKVQLGSLRMMQTTSTVIGKKLMSFSARIVERGHGLSCLSCDGRVIGMFAFAERLRPETRQAVARIRKLDCRICVLTGDHSVRGAAIARELGVETIADLVPEEKITQVRRLRGESGRVAMVGDGLNDAPALAAADVGIAMGCGPDLTRRTADVCLLGNDLCTVPFAIQLARRTVRTVRINLAWAFAYNLVAIPMAMLGTLRPVYAAIAMVVSSLIVVTNTLGLERPDQGESL